MTINVAIVLSDARTITFQDETWTNAARRALGFAADHSWTGAYILAVYIAESDGAAMVHTVRELQADYNAGLPQAADRKEEADRRIERARDWARFVQTRRNI